MQNNYHYHEIMTRTIKTTLK